MTDLLRLPTDIEIGEALGVVSILGVDNPVALVIRRLAFHASLGASQAAICYGASRSSKWPAVRDSFLEGKSCAICGGTDQLIAHHKEPFHSRPDLELDTSNLIPLCQARRYGVHCHLLFGHLGDFRLINTKLDEDVSEWSKRFDR